MVSRRLASEFDSTPSCVRLCYLLPVYERISLTADAPSFKVKVPRTSRAGVNETLTGEQVAARLVSVMRSRAHRGKTMDEWRKEQLAWLLDPVRPAKKG